MAKRADGKGKRRSRESGGDEALALVRDHTVPGPVWQRAAARLTGARVCYGKPIEAHGHVVVPVATLRTIGGLGFGQGAPSEAVGEAVDGAPAGAESTGGGGGGLLDARPIGFIDIGPDGVRYQPIEVPSPPRRMGAAALLALGVVVVARALGGRASGGGLAALRRRPTGSARWPARSLRR